MKFPLLVLLLSVVCLDHVSARTLKAEDLDTEFKTRVRAQLVFDTQTKVGSVEIEYRSSLNICFDSGGVSPIEVVAVFTLGEGPSARNYVYKLYRVCPWSPNYPGYPSARLSFNSKDGINLDWMGKSDPYIWDKLFPPDSRGRRWFALRVAFRVSQQGAGHWDSKSGQDYRLIFK